MVTYTHDRPGQPPDLHLVPHTHWDREWYEPFQRFRLRLVDLLDEVLAWAEADPRFHFTLDGQLACVDDYLEVFPEHRDRIAALVRSGQLAVGPWQILLDEFLCSGENIIRNLELGWAGAESLGGAMPVGYLPDMFGHCAQMPQILARAGLDHACLWRGVPASVPGHAFRWRAPDGTSVRVEYLAGSYGNAANLFADPERFNERARGLERTTRDVFGDDPVLAMYGTDHSAPIRSVVSLVEGLERTEDAAGLTMRIGTLGDYVLARDPGRQDLPAVRGELRSHATANILPGVISVRTHLKAAMARAERMVERYAEPFAALWSADWPARFLDMAWRRLVDASGHDSVTGCGVDETAVQVFARIAEAEQLGQAVRDRVSSRLAVQVPRDHALLLNPTPRPRLDLVTVDLPVPAGWGRVDLETPDGRRYPTQEEGRTPAALHQEQLDPDGLDSFLRRIHGRELFGREIVRWRVDGPTRRLDIDVAPHGGQLPFDLDELRRAAGSAMEQRSGTWTVTLAEMHRRILTGRVEVPALGWTCVRAAEEGRAPAASDPVSVTDRSMTNGLVRVDVHPDGTLRLEAADGTVLDGVGRIVDGGDRGDTYNYAPPGRDGVVDRPTSTDTELIVTGSTRSVLAVRRTYDWPAAIDWADDRRARLTRVGRVDMRVELRAGEQFVRLGILIDNSSEDHRLRLHVPLARATTTSYAEGQFAVVERGLTAEGGPSGEHPLPTFPAHGFVDAGGAAVLLTQATEYEVVGAGSELAITLLRAVGQLSRNVHPLREEPAGPEIPTPDAQQPGRTRVDLAVLPHAVTWADDDVVGAAECYRHPVYVVPGRGTAATAPAAAEGLHVEGQGVVLTSLRRRDGRLEVRLVAQTPRATTVRLHRVTGAQRVDLLGRRGEVLETALGRVDVLLQPWEIATIQLDR